MSCEFQNNSSLISEDKKILYEFMLKTDKYNEASSEIKIELNTYIGQVNSDEIKSKLVERYIDYRLRERDHLLYEIPYELIDDIVYNAPSRITVVSDLNQIDDYADEVQPYFSKVIENDFVIVISTGLKIHEDYEAILTEFDNILDERLKSYLRLQKDDFDNPVFRPTGFIMTETSNIVESIYTADLGISSEDLLYRLIALEEYLLESKQTRLDREIESLYYKHLNALLEHAYKIPKNDYLMILKSYTDQYNNSVLSEILHRYKEHLILTNFEYNLDSFNFIHEIIKDSVLIR